MAPTPPLPVSATHNGINMLGIAAFFAAFFACRYWEIGGATATFLLAGAYGATILLLETLWLRTPWKDSAGLDFTRRRSSPERCGIKLVGVYGCIAFVALLFCLFPYYLV